MSFMFGWFGRGKRSIVTYSSHLDSFRVRVIVELRVG